MSVTHVLRLRLVAWLGAICGALLFLAAPAHAQVQNCTVTGSTTLNGTYQLDGTPDLQASLSVSCAATGVTFSQAVPLCLRVTAGSWSSGSRALLGSTGGSLPYQASFVGSGGTPNVQDSGGFTSMIGTASITSGSDGTQAITGTMTVKIALPDTAAVSPDQYSDQIIGTFYPAVTSAGAVTTCDLASWSDAGWTLTLNVVRPRLCAIATVTGVDFGTIASAPTLSDDIDAQGDISVRCDSGTPYTIYLGDGGNRVGAGTGLRQMANGSARLPYQLFQSGNPNQVWDTTGMAQGTGGAGGVSDSGNGNDQPHTVYARIPAGTTLPTTIGTYTDTVIVSVIY